MTQSKKDELVQLLLPAAIRRTENASPSNVVWYISRIISELEERGYFKEED
jgi:hypothetical protein